MAEDNVRRMRRGEEEQVLACLDRSGLLGRAGDDMIEDMLHGPSSRVFVWVDETGIRGAMAFKEFGTCRLVYLLCVDKPRRREGIATDLVDLLKKITRGHARRNQIVSFVSERDLNMHLFYRAVGISADSIETLPDGSTSYRFVWHGGLDLPFARAKWRYQQTKRARAK